MVNEETQKEIEVALARQLGKILPGMIANAVDTATKSLRADVLDLAQRLENTRNAVNVGVSTMHNGPKPDELKPYLRAKLSQHSLQEVAQEIADAEGVSLNEFVKRD